MTRSAANERPVERKRLAVQAGGEEDVCPRCGIWRKNAGYLKETCGEFYQLPGCFVVDVWEVPK